MRQTNRPRVFATAKPSKIALPARQDVAALAKPEAFDRWHAGIRSAGEIGKNVITMYDVIGEDFWSGTGVTVKRVDAALRSIGEQDVEVHINSPGGDMFEGIAILNRLLEHKAKVTVKVLGLAASAASIIAMAGEERLMAPSSFLMIHDCWVVAMGNRHDMADTSAWLAPFDDAMANVYAERTGLTAKAVAAMMDAETWLNGNEALKQGFATGLLSADDLKEDEATSQDAAANNAIRQAELGLCRSMSRTEARALITKIKGTPGAAPDARQGEPATHDAGDLSWWAKPTSELNLMRS